MASGTNGDHLRCSRCGWHGRIWRLGLLKRFLPWSAALVIGSSIACLGCAWYIGDVPVHPLDQPLVTRFQLILVATGVLGGGIIAFFVGVIRRSQRPVGSICIRCGSTDVLQTPD